MPYILLKAIFTPLFSSLLLMSYSRLLSRKWISIIGCLSIFISFFCFLLFLILPDFPTEGFRYTLYEWIPSQKINANFGFYLDSLALLMALIITGIGFLIHLYSIGYMSEDKDYGRYYACMNLFIFCMLLLVIADNLMLLFIGWEGVGLASYLLIGFWFQRPSAAQAAKKAFVVNRIGDVGLFLGLILTLLLFGTTDTQHVAALAQKQFAIGAPILTLLTLLYFSGAIGKSAQLPLFSWLPDAMEGPTPVSALIHAATMVTAGVYLVVRMYPVFLMAPFTLQVIGITGTLTALFAALSAIGQTDLKRVLAYSTVSQLGFMFLACGAGAFYSAMFHLTTHAFIKALLFLSAGNVIHMLHDETDMRKMGGLSRFFPKSNILFFIGVLALSGIPPFAAFFSKDLILEQEHMQGHEILFYLALLAAILTGFYLMRAYCLTFLGESKNEAVLPHEAPSIMIAPTLVVALLSIFGGILGYAFAKSPLLHQFLHEIAMNHAEEELQSRFTLNSDTWMAMGGSVIGIAVAFWLYGRKREKTEDSYPILKNAFYLERVYEYSFVYPLQWIGKSVLHFIEPKIIHGSVFWIDQMIDWFGKKLQLLQSGQLRSYIAWMLIGSAIILFFMSRS
jgi:NADH-quinone oxidoreductase subunit L